MTETITQTLHVPDDTGDRVNASIIVNVDLLDTLMNLAGELVLSRNQLLQSFSTANNKAMELSSQRIDMITSELQEAIMRTRMQPMEKILNQLDRMVRDLSHQLEKSIDLVIEGKEVELDKTILESIHDTLINLVKYSIEHGIETPGEREKAGKTGTGKIVLRAFHDAGQIAIVISDDGKGLDPEKMDVVATHIETLGGTLEIDSKKGVGTDIQIRLPLTLGIIASQITSVGSERYALPQVNLDELLRIPVDKVKEKIEKVGDADVFRLRGKLLPLLNLSKLLGIEKNYIDPENGMEQLDRRNNIADRRSRRHPIGGEATNDKYTDSVPNCLPRKTRDRRSSANNVLNIAVVSSGAYKYGLIVDRLYDSEEIVVKPMGRHFKKCLAFAGATIMGDGKVALILDIANLAQMAELSTVSELKEFASSGEDAAQTGKPKTALLIFKNSENEYFAVPLEKVARIERLQTSTIEQIGGSKVVQYRGGTLRLCELSQVVNLSPLNQKKRQEILVFRAGKREMGLMVNPPVDTIEVFVDIDEKTLRQPAISGSIVVNGHTMLVVDVFELAKVMNPEWFT